MANREIGDSLLGSDRFASRYEIQQQLGKRSGRQTLLARDRETQQDVVIKLLSFGSEFEWDDLKLFEREIETLKALEHPSIPRYLDYFEIDLPNSKKFAFVQNYIPAKSLEQHLKAGRTFSEDDLKQLAKALLEILIYLHERQPPVIHRDIKPSNILLHNRSGNSIGEVHLVDFGSVQTLVASEGGTMTVVGTYGYMPPEQFGARTVPASDLYSLGATLIYLVTGKHPADLPQKEGIIQFEGETPYLSPALLAWLRRTIQPSLDRRFTSARQALHALENLRPCDSLTVGKPSGSKVLLKKGADSLEIVIPPGGFDLGVGFLCLFAIAWNSFLVAWTGGAVFLAPFPINLVFGLFSLPFWGAGIGMVIGILFSLFGRVRLGLNQQWITLKYELLGFKYNRPRASNREHINKIEYTKRSFTKDSDGDRVELQPQIVIWAGTQKYELGGKGVLSEPELDWLADELSEWLGLPIVRK